MSAPPNADGLAALKLLEGAFLDAWFLVDEEDRILDFNAAFFSLFPRAVGRSLKTLTCRDAMKLGPCGPDACLRTRCANGKPLRMDEVEALIGEQQLRLIISATPLPLSDGRTATLIVLRDVTDEARVQSRYQDTLESAQQVHAELVRQLEERTRELMASNDELNRVEAELAELRRRG